MTMTQITASKLLASSGGGSTTTTTMYAAAKERKQHHPLGPLHGSSTTTVLVTVAVLAALVTALWVGVVKTSSTTASPDLREAFSSPAAAAAAAAGPPPEALQRGPPVSGVDFLWQRPGGGGGSSGSTTPAGLLFVAHGCHHAMTDWWPSTTTKEGVCPECLGLPEERAIVQMALDLGLVVVALSSSRGHCWSSGDGPRVARVLTHLCQTEFGGDSISNNNQSNNNKDVFVAAFGASSGGKFVASILPLALQEEMAAAPEQKKNHKNNCSLSGFIAQIASSAPPLAETAADQDRLFSSAVYITMNGDPNSEEHAGKIVEKLSARSIPARHTRVRPVRLTDDFFATRIYLRDIPEKDAKRREAALSLSRDMVQALIGADMVDPTTRLLKVNPRDADWRTVLKPLVSQASVVVVPPDSLVPDQSPISEVLNVAYNQHEMTRDGVHDALTFLLEEHKKKQQHQQEQPKQL